MCAAASAVRAMVVGCAQDGGLPQLGCSCTRCDYARHNPGYRDGMVACLGVMDEAMGKVFLVDATPDMGTQIWLLQHSARKDGSTRPLELGGILLTHAHTGHYTGLLQLGKEGADLRDVPVFCTSSMASFLRNNEPWGQLVERGNITVREVDPTGTSGESCVALTPSVSFKPVFVPHRAELSDTVAFLFELSSRGSVISIPEGATNATSGDGKRDPEKLKLFYCPDTDRWSGWAKGIWEWCQEVDVALLDATFFDKDELGERDMSQVCHPLVQDTIKELAGCRADVVLTHMNHTNPILTKDSLQRAKVEASGFRVAEFGMDWSLPTSHLRDD